VRLLALDFLPGTINGSRLDLDVKPTILAIPARESRVLTGLTRGIGTLGLVEVTGDDRLVIDARLRVSAGKGPAQEVQLPVISSENQFDSGALTVLPGWYRDSSRRTSVGLVNLSNVSNQCHIDIVNLRGKPLSGGIEISLPPLSLSYWSDALAAAGIQGAAEARLQLACAGPSYAYSLITDRASGELVLRRASRDLTSTLQGTFSNDGVDDESDPDDPGSGTPDLPSGAVIETGAGFVRLRIPGLVHAPTRGKSKWIYQLDLPGITTIDRITASVTVDTGAWGKQRDRPQHHLLQVSNARWGDGGWDYWVRPDRTPGVVQNGLLVTRGRNAGNEVKRGTLSQLPKRYSVRVVQSGKAVAGEGLEITRGVLPPREGPVFIQLGADLGAGHDPKVPSYGWKWRDLEIEIRGR
jgi:hypothetical protein